MKIIITGFEPFAGAVINPAYEAVLDHHEDIKVSMGTTM